MSGRFASRAAVVTAVPPGPTNCTRLAARSIFSLNQSSRAAGAVATTASLAGLLFTRRVWKRSAGVAAAASRAMARAASGKRNERSERVM